ncbi:Lipoprotein-releasing system ATP-binding protein LolD, partial [Durusdinium trenchii]
AKAAAATGSVQDEALRLLDRLGLNAAHAHKPALALSVGQHQRVAAARALIGGPGLVIADEPTSALDAHARDAFLALLTDECARSGAALLFVSHDLSLASRFARSMDLPALNRCGNSVTLRTIDSTELIVGARGGAINLLLYSVFRLGDPTANISWESYELISTAPSVEWTVPISLGDSHRGYRVVGTLPAYFEHYGYGRDQRLVFAEGRAFEDLYEVVLGAEVATRLDYALGSELVLSHGIGDVSFAEHSGHDFHVVGILAPTGTPVDRSVHVSLASIELIHEGWQAGIAPGAATAASATTGDLTPESVTAVFVGVSSPIQILGLQRQINTYRGEALTAIMPGVALGQLWQVIGTAERAFAAISLLVILVGLTGILTALSSSINERRREMAVLRAAGARPHDIFFLLVTEAAVVAFGAAIIGIQLANIAFAALGAMISSRYGISLPAGLGMEEIWVLVLMPLAGAAMGVWPAIRALRNALSDG